jgi:hypothetical protein
MKNLQNKVPRTIILTLYQHQHYFDFLTTRFYSAATATILDVAITAAVMTSTTKAHTKAKI